MTEPAVTTSPLARYDTFLDEVGRQCATPAGRAKLRRAVAAATRPESPTGRRGTGDALQLLRRLAAERMHPERKINYLLVAGILAQHPDAGADAESTAGKPATRYTEGNLGAAVGRAVRGGDVTAGRADQTMRLLTRKTPAGLRRALPRVVHHLDPALSGLDLAVLLSDLNGWPFRAADISRRWWESYTIALPTASKEK
ncbi:type I-E CRISPR-associated protein Cse2/CasB [Streptomyces sp. NPDC021098]|uniref:type I-E CRISPR-associated protein Cse2/CasB n=1 Tax=unclassified Streptomyces TaxID=2593676 RepID=UPI0037AAE768